MAMTAAERAKKYRDNKKKDPLKHQDYLLKEKQRYRKRKENGEFDLSKKSQREMTLLRRKWRLKKRDERKKKTAIRKGEEFMMINSPCTSPAREDIHEYENMPEVLEHVQINEKTKVIPHQVSTGKKRRVRKKAKAYRTIDKLKNERLRYKAMWETTRKRLQRLKKDLGKTSVRLEAPKQTKVFTVTPHSHKVVTKLVKKIYNRTGHSVTWNIEMRKKIRQFLEEDLYSSQAPGKKDTITRGKIKMQKRYLNDTLLNLYKSFLDKFTDCKISYSSFCRLRPFWIVQRNVDSRETCLCKVHENVKYRIQKLNRLKIISESNPDQVAKSLVCDITKKECAYRECCNCLANEIQHSLTDDNAGEQVTYHQWVNRIEEISTSKGRKSVTKTLKVQEQDTIETLLKDTSDLMKNKYLKHIFNIRHQYVTLKHLKENITNLDAVMHVDFSENFNCKLSEEVQSMHFGGSRNQISLHTVVLYTKDKIESFCTVSDNTHHGPGAIWAHLEPVLDSLKEFYHGIRRVHFVSDGPCTQYRSKVNFYLLHQQILDKYEFEIATWNFTESGHGKSAADGVGGTVKRTADRLVANGIDIPDARSFCKHTERQLRNVKLVFVEDSRIERYIDMVPSGLLTVKGTMKLHQVTVRRQKKGVLFLKNLSCFCKWPEQCACYILIENPEHQLPVSNIRAPSLDDVSLVSSSENVAMELTSDLYPSNGGTNRNGDMRPHPDLVGTWCVVKYETQLYPGIIQDLDDESAEVKCMSRIGTNRFFWPLIEDIIWYRWDDIIMTIPEPKHVTSRHVQIDPEIWQSIEDK